MKKRKRETKLNWAEILNPKKLLIDFVGVGITLISLLILYRALVY